MYKNCIDSILNIYCFNETIANIPQTNFLYLVIDDTLNWDIHIDQLISRMNSARYAITAVQTMLLRKSFSMLHFSYGHSDISCGIMFGCNTASSINIYTEYKTKKNKRLKPTGYVMHQEV